MRGPLASLPLLFLVLAGCAVAGGREPDAEFLTLCRLTYPDGSAVDCSADFPSLPNGAPPREWVCLEQISEARSLAQLWGDGAGKYGIYQSVRAGGEVVSRVHVQTPSGNSTTFGHAKGAWFLPVAPTGDRVHWEVTSYNATGRATLNGSPASFRVHLSSFQRDPWLLWVFSAGGRNYYTQSMTQVRFADLPPEWVPVNLSHTLVPLNVTVGSVAGASSDYLDRDPLPLLPGSNPGRCTL